MNSDQLLSQVLVWIHGNTGIRYEIDYDKTKTTESTITWFSKPVPVERGHLAMVVKSVSIVVCAAIDPLGGVRLDKTGHTVLSCQFNMEMIDGTHKHHTVNFEFSGTYLFRIT